MTSETDVSSVAGGMWTTTQQTWHLKAGRSKYVQLIESQGIESDTVSIIIHYSIFKV